MILGFYKKGNKAQVYHKASCAMYELPNKENQEIQLIDISRKKNAPTDLQTEGVRYVNRGNYCTI